MENRTISHYLTFALKKLDPPADWEDILKFVLTTLNSTWRPKYYTKELRKALEVGLRFGIIREMKSKYYLYEYAEINSFGEISYEFTDNPLSILRIKNEGEKDDEKEQDDGKEKDEDESCSEQNDIVFNLEKESGHTSVRTDLQESDRTTLEKKPN